jgi:lipopolysaccharide export system ATP-binding protein
MDALEAKKLEKTYRGRKVVKGASFQVKHGEVVGLLGPNGAGKTTSFYMVVGLVKPDQGRIVLDGVDITRMPMYQRARNGIGYLAQEPSVFRKLTVAENLVAILETLGLSDLEMRDRRDNLLEELGITSCQKPGVHPVRRRAPARGDRPGPDHVAQVHPS